MMLRMIATLALGCVLAAVATAPAGGQALRNAGFDQGDLNWTLSLNDLSVAGVEREIDDREGVLCVHATPAPGAQPWSMRVQQTIDRPIAAGTPVTLTVVARSPDRVPIRPFVEQSADPYRKLAGGAAELTPVFDTYVFRGEADRAYEAEQWRVTVHLAAGTGRIEIDSIDLAIGEGASAEAQPRLEGAGNLRPREREVTPEGQAVMAADVISSFALSGSEMDKGEIEMVRVDDAGFDWAVRLTTNELAERDYNIQIVAANEAAIRRDDVLHLTYFARTLDTDDETGEGKTSAIFEVKGPPYTKTMMFPARFQRQWTKIQVVGKAKNDYAPGDAQLAFRMGYEPQVIEIGGIELINYGDTRSMDSLPVTRLDYPGRAPDARWRAEAEARIAEHRQGDLSVRVVDASGQPVAGAEVRVEMRRHAFRFGSVMNAEWLNRSPEPEGRSAYLEKFAELFNAVTFESSTKWPQWLESERREAVRAILPWLEERGMYIRGHTIIWPSWKRTPAYLRNLADDPLALNREVLDHIESIVPALADHVHAWDVVNEPFSDYDVLDIVGREKMIEWFEATHRLDSDADLYLNEASAPNTPPSHPVYDDLEANLKMLLEAGAPIDGVGLQGHFGWNLRSPEEILEILDRFAALGLKIEITEFDVNITDQDLQGDYLRDAMTVFFSHPAVVSFIQWGFWEGRHWRPDAAMFRKDWSIKPNGEAYLDLVFDQWWTDRALTTDERGKATVRGFLGEYRVTVTTAAGTVTKDVTLTADGAEVRLAVAP